MGSHAGVRAAELSHLAVRQKRASECAVFGPELNVTRTFGFGSSKRPDTFRGELNAPVVESGSTRA
eukprot:454938-Pyramimonas_sp.AAC.1